MQSSLVVTIRALLLLAAAMGIPAMAVMGTPVLQRLRGELPPERPAVAASQPPPAAPPPRAETVHRPAAGAPSGRRAEAAPSSRTASPAPWQSPPQISAAANALWTPRQTVPLVSPRANTPGDSPPADPFAPLQQRLKQLGAVYFRLEAFGASRYRFRCELPLPGNSRYNRQFEATDEDPLAAMQRVVADVENWRQRHGELARRPSPGGV